MVNVLDSKRKNSTKSILLHKLKEHKRPISGEKLSKWMNLSRVSIWKAVQSLEKEGYKIESTRNGYRLLSNSRSFYDLENIDTEYDIFNFSKVDSTMEKTRELENKGKRNFLVLADEQTKGKGREKKKWISEKGGIFMTSSLSVSIPVEMYSYISLLILLNVTHFFHEDLKIPVFMKWPNDLYLKGKKLGGILIDIYSSGNKINRIEIGMGLNIDNKVPENATNLQDYTKKNIQKEYIISTILEIQKESINYLHKNKEILKIQMKKLSHYMIKGDVEIKKWPNETIKGKIIDINEKGFLRVDTGVEEIYISPGETEKVVIK